MFSDVVYDLVGIKFWVLCVEKGCVWCVGVKVVVSLGGFIEVDDVSLCVGDWLFFVVVVLCDGECVCLCDIVF